MQNLFASVCAAALFVGAISVRADDSSEINYSGGFTCSTNEYATDWKISKGLAGEIAATVYYQRVGSSQVQWLDLSERSTPGGNRLFDANGNPRLDVASDGDTIRAIWMEGAPASECSTFAVTRSESPRDRFDKLFALMGTPEPGEDVATQVADKTRLPPIFHALPELDQQTYQQRYAELNDAFWKRYRETLAKDLAQRPLVTEDDRRAFARRLSAALSGNFRFTFGRDGFRTMFATLQQAADRYAANDSSPDQGLYAGGVLTCQRFEAILKADPYFDFAKLEFAAGIPSDYWTRALAEDLLAGLRTCKGVPDDYAQQLTRDWPEIQKKQQAVQALRQEQARLLALPVTVATLVETGNLQPNAELVQSYSSRSEIYQRFFGASLDARREELLNVSVAAVKEWAASYTIEKPEVAKTVSAACETLGNLSLVDEKRDLVRQTCETANNAIGEKQAEQAVKQIETAFLTAGAGDDAAKAARSLCESLPSTVSSHAATRVHQACADGREVLERKEEALKCDQAIAASGASSELLDSTVAVLEANGASPVVMKELICRAANRNAQLSLSSSGYMMWKTQLMEMKLEGAREGEGLLHLVLNPAENQADWIVGTEDEDTKAVLAKQGITVEVLTACIMGTSACRP
jgi:hypothetical protein